MPPGVRSFRHETNSEFLSVAIRSQIKTARTILASRRSIDGYKRPITVCASRMCAQSWCSIVWPKLAPTARELVQCCILTAPVPEIPSKSPEQAASLRRYCRNSVRKRPGDRRSSSTRSTISGIVDKRSCGRHKPSKPITHHGEAIPRATARTDTSQSSAVKGNPTPERSPMAAFRASGSAQTA